jgi:hypothetical protein
MPNTRLIIKTIEVTPDGLLIREMSIIDSVSGEQIRVPNFTPELCEFLKMLEIDTEQFFKIQEMRKANPALNGLIDTFKLYT